MMDFTVGIRDFRRNLSAVLPHTPTKAALTDYYRIRIIVDRDLMWFLATDRFTIAVSIASVLEHNGPEGVVLGSFDILPTDATKILALFKAGDKDEDPETPEWTLRFDLTHDDRLRITDTSGLVDGESLWLNRVPLSENFPDLLSQLAKWTDEQPALLEEFGMQGAYAKRFVSAAGIYNQPLQWSAHHQSPLIVRCGEDFLGAVMNTKPTEDQALQRKEWAEAWARRLPAPPTMTVVI